MANAGYEQEERKEVELKHKSFFLYSRVLAPLGFVGVQRQTDKTMYLHTVTNENFFESWDAQLQ